MWKEIYIETIKKIVRSSKTHIFSIFTVLAIVLYVGIILPNTQPMDTVDMERLEIDMQANKSIMEDREKTGKTEANSFTGISTYQRAKNEYASQRSFKTTIETGNAKRLIQNPYMPEKLGKEIQDHYLMNSPFPLKDMRYDQTNKHMRLQNYLEEVNDISFHMIQEKTAWQQIHLLFLNWGPIILSALVVFLVSDVVTRERQERTQKAGVPYGWRRYLFVQSIAAFSFVVLFIFVALVLFWLATGVMFGFGSSQLNVPHFSYLTDYGSSGDEYGLMTIGSFMIQILPFFLLITYLMVRMSGLFSLWFKHDVVVMAAGFFALMFEKLYFDRRMRGIAGIPLGFYPQTYIDYGKIVSGEKSFLLNTDSITIQRGIVVLLVTIGFIEGLLWISATIKHRQKYLR